MSNRIHRTRCDDYECDSLLRIACNHRLVNARSQNEPAKQSSVRLDSRCTQAEGEHQFLRRLLFTVRAPLRAGKVEDNARCDVAAFESCESSMSALTSPAAASAKHAAMSSRVPTNADTFRNDVEQRNRKVARRKSDEDARAAAP